jgi:hypothetical protein
MTIRLIFFLSVSVGIVAQVHGPQHGLPEVLGIVERPQGGLQALAVTSQGRPDRLSLLLCTWVLRPRRDWCVL